MTRIPSLIPFPWIFVMNFKNDLLQKICRVDLLDNIASNKDMTFLRTSILCVKVADDASISKVPLFSYNSFRIGKSMLVGNEEFFFFNISFSLSLSLSFLSLLHFLWVDRRNTWRNEWMFPPLFFVRLLFRLFN